MTEVGDNLITGGVGCDAEDDIKKKTSSSLSDIIFFKNKTQFTPLARTRQDCLVLFCLVGGVNRTSDKSRLFSSVFSLSKTVFTPHFETVLTCRQFCSHRQCGQDKTEQSCLVCVGGVNQALAVTIFNAQQSIKYSDNT